MDLLIISVLWMVLNINLLAVKKKEEKPELLSTLSLPLMPAYFIKSSLKQIPEITNDLNINSLNKENNLP